MAIGYLGQRGHGNQAFKFRKGYDRIFAELLALRGLESVRADEHERIWADIFPNCRHLFLTRRNKVRQAVSWWEAIQKQVWHLERGEARPTFSPGFYEEKYDFDALSHLFREAALHECAIEEYFSQHGIKPLTLVYEDMVLDFTGTIRSVLDYLEISQPRILGLRQFYQPTANEGTELWV